MARRSRARKPRVQKAHELDFTWEGDGEVLHASHGWVEWGGELILSMGETSGGAPYGLSLQEYQAIQVRETEREQRLESAPRGMNLSPDGFTPPVPLLWIWDWPLSLNSQGIGRVALAEPHGSRLFYISGNKDLIFLSPSSKFSFKQGE
jgi:hypothetical protein